MLYNIYCHIFIVLSEEQEANLLSFNLIIQITFEVCPSKVEILFIVFEFHILIVLSKLPDANKSSFISHNVLTE